MIRSTKRLRPVFVGALVSVAVLLPRQFSLAQAVPKPLEITQVDTTAYPNVEATVTVPNEVSVSTLSAASFRLSEGGSERPVTIERVPTDDLSVVLVIDTSASMRGAAIREARDSAAAFVRTMPAATPVAVVGFGNTTRVYSGFDAKRGATELAIQNMQASGNTRLYDAVLQAADLFGQRDRTPNTSQVMVILTDGGDTRSTASLGDVTKVLGSSGISVTAIALATAESDLASLTVLAQSAGGVVVPAADPTALAKVFSGISDSVLNQYRVTWTAENRGPTEITLDLSADNNTYRGVASVDYPAPVPVVADSGPVATEPAPATFVAPVKGSGRSWLLLGIGSGFAALLLASGVVLWPRGPRRRLALEFGQVQKHEYLSPTKRALATADSLLARSNRRQRLQALLERAGMRSDPAAAAVVTGALAFCALALGLAFGSVLFSVALAALTVAVLYALVRRRADRRSKLFQDQLETTLQLMTNSLRAGYGISQAIDTVAAEAEAPTSEEFRRVVRETRLGMDQIASLHACADRVQCEDLVWITDAIAVNRDIGGNLTELFTGVADILRARNRLRRQVQALSAEGRLSANILIVLPFAVGGWMMLVNRPYIGELLRGGNKWFLVAGAVLMSIGFLWTRKIIRIRY